MIPNFEILGRIGGGAYGEVYLARSITGMYRAVKVVSRQDFEYEKTFEREFEGIQRYEKVSQDHTGLVDVLHVGRDEEAGHYYYVMELADDESGEHEDVDVDSYKPRTLSSDLRQHPGRSVGECVALGASLAEALGHLHLAGLTHRDVKPSNIIFVKGVPKLADVGLVARSGQRTFVGTEGYLPPEGPGTSSADLYSLAMVLYEMHTGKDRLDFPELPTNLEIPPTVNRDEWRGLNAAICRAGSPDPRKRYESAQVFARTLRNVTGGAEPTPARRGKRVSAIGVAAAATILLMASGFGGYWLWKDNRDFVDTNSTLLAEPAPSAANESSLPGEPVEEVVVETPSSGGAGKGTFSLIGDSAETELGHEEVVISDFVNGDGSGTVEPSGDPGHGFDASSTDEPMIVAELVADPVPQGKVRIISDPSGASVWVDGEEIGITETKLIEFDAGPIEITLKHPGYHDWHYSGKVEEGLGVQLIEAELLPDRSPIDGNPWFNSLGIEFSPDPDGNYVSRNPITTDAFRTFRDETGRIVSVAGKEGKVQVADDELLWAFCDWMTERDRAWGFLGTDRYYRARPTEGGFFECLLDDEFGTLILNTEPPGAEVFLNDEAVGETPVTLGDVRLGPYRLEFVLPGYEVETKTGVLESPVAEVVDTDPLSRDNSAVLGRRWVNSQGMEMVPVDDLLVAVFETRVRDFREYVTEAAVMDALAPGFSQELNHPAVGIGFAEARAFCNWLTARERARGLIRSWQRYRLPTDAEWSRFAGLENEMGSSPEARGLSGSVTYPWGDEWPPPEGAGNFADASAAGLFGAYVIEDYDDGYSATAPVGSFEAGPNGLFDLSGNVWEWVRDAFGDTAPGVQVVRGGGWNSYDREVLETRYRNPVPANSNDDAYGFRYVLENTDERE
ncbi:MAG: bifunctional serine/threonine-protein kinase/formylglycine-generating enzyme family protein [Verrucomicrobiales bacterium]